MSKTWKDGSTRRWRTIRAAVLIRDGYLCQIKTAGRWWTRTGWKQCLVRADCVHHTLGREITGDDPAYLQAACSPCNLKVGEPKKVETPKGRGMTRWY